MVHVYNMQNVNSSECRLYIFTHYLKRITNFGKCMYMHGKTGAQSDKTPCVLKWYLNLFNLFKIEKKNYCINSEESTIQCDNWNDETCDTLNVEETDRGYRTSVNLPSAFFKHIIGRKGETKRRLEIETKTQIKIPREGVEGEIGQWQYTGRYRYI